MTKPWYTEGQWVIVVLIILSSTSLYGLSFITESNVTPIEPQSLFTLYGAVLGYLFGSREKKKDQEHQIVQERMSQ